MKIAEIKPSFDEQRQVLGKVLPLTTPFTVILDTSEVCNFWCSYCFRSKQEKTGWGYVSGQGLMDMETFEKAASQLFEFPEEIRQISLSNHGEPLANRQVPDMSLRLREMGYKGRLTLHTNASLLDCEYAKELGTAGLSKIVISLQGLNRERYREVCRNTVDTDTLFDNIELLYRESHKAPIRTEICVKIPNVALREGEKEFFYRRFEKISDRMFVEHIVPIWKNLDVEFGTEEQTKYGTVFPKQQCCRLIFDTLVVLPNGDIYPCTQMQNEECLGNIQEVSMRDAWNSNQRQELLKNILELQPPEMCKGCYIRQNSVFSEEDMIDGFRGEILNRIENAINAPKKLIL